MPETPDDCCEPGDITLTQVPGGWLVGRALEQLGPGPWWTYVATYSTLEEALRQARELTTAANVRAWFHESGERYRLIPSEDLDRAG